MINETMYGLGNAPSAIRELFAYGLERKAEIGEDKVFDFSIGNPSVPAPDKVAKTMHELADMPPAQLHAYSPASGLDETKTAIAGNLNRRFGTDYAAKNFYLTTGAASCLSCCIKAVIVDPGDEIIVISPYFPEYRVWIEADGGTCVEVPAREDNFQIDLDALSAAINERTRAVIINSPNNPVGVVYTRETLEREAQGVWQLTVPYFRRAVSRACVWPGGFLGSLYLRQHLGVLFLVEVPFPSGRPHRLRFGSQRS